MENGSRQRILGLLFSVLILLTGAGAHGARLLGKRDLWDEGGMMIEVVHARRLQSAPYCVAAPNADTTKLQDALDWACGPEGSSGGGVDCSAILQSGSCYNPNTVAAHASYAFDYYYVKQNGASGSCDFDGLATTTSNDPSTGSCVYPSLGSGVPSPSSNFSSPSPVGGLNGTFNSTPTAGSNSGSAVGPRLSVLHLFGSLMAILFLASRV